MTNIFVWYLIAFNTIHSLVINLSGSNTTLLLVLGVNSTAIAASALIGSVFFRKTKKNDLFFYLWVIVGVIISLIPLMLNVANLNSVLAVSIFFGVYFGIGMPKTLGHFSASIGTENLGKISGITFLLIGLISSILGVLVLNNIVFTCILLAAIRLVGLGSLRLPVKKDELSQQGSQPKNAIIPLKKTFILYFIPWTIFCIVNYLTIPIITNIFQANTYFISVSPVIENVIIAMSAVTCGFLADRLGRKRLIIVGFIMLGIGFAALGLFADSASMQISAGYIYTVSDGIAWGIFYVMFLLTLWGDIAQNRNSEIIYAAGALPYVFGTVFRLSLQNPIATIAPTQVFSFASVFLFLAVLPLLYAPETLSEKIISNQDINSYVNKALEKAKKEHAKKLINQDYAKAQEIETNEDSENLSPADVEARKLAEKYY